MYIKHELEKFLGIWVHTVYLDEAKGEGITIIDALKDLKYPEGYKTPEEKANEELYDIIDVVELLNGGE